VICLLQNIWNSSYEYGVAVLPVVCDVICWLSWWPIECACLFGCKVWALESGCVYAVDETLLIVLSFDNLNILGKGLCFQPSLVVCCHCIHATCCSKLLVLYWILSVCNRYNTIDCLRYRWVHQSRRLGRQLTCFGCKLHCCLCYNQFVTFLSSPCRIVQYSLGS
jgi:hypothetical protein